MATTMNQQAKQRIAEAKQPRRRRPRGGAVMALYSAASVGGFLAAWEVLSLLMHSTELLPSPVAVIRMAVDLAHGSFQGVSLWSDIWISSMRVIAGFFIGLVGGALLGLAMALSEPLKRLFDPIIESLRPVPPLAWIPLLVIWFGIGEFPKILLLIVTTVPIVSIATMSAVLGVREDMSLAARSLGANNRQVMLHVLLPAALPGILTGARIALGACWSSLVAVEMVAAERGLGWLIWQASSYLETAAVFVGMILIAGIAVGMNRLLLAMEAWLVPWKGKA